MAALLEARVQRLEELVAHQDRLIERLNEVVREQANALDGVQAELRQLHERASTEGDTPERGGAPTT